MIKVLIVDDEVLVRVGIKSLIDWEGNGFKLVGEAQNGEEALEKIVEFSPEILITDIKMPKLDGIQLLKEINKKGQKIYSVVLSCYNEFEFVRQAMKYGARDYVLKLSMQPQELLDILLRLKDEIQRERNKLHVVDNASDSKCENDNKSEFLHKLIRSQKLNDEEMDCNRFELRLDFAKSNVAVICMTVDNYKYIIDKDLQTSGSNILSKSLINMLNEISANEMCELLDNGNGEVVFFIGEGRDTVDFCKYIQEALSRYLNISVSFGISNYCSNWKLISEHYEQSRAAVEGKFYSGFGSINHFKDIIEYDNQVKLYTYDEEKRLFDMLSSGKYIEVHEYIRCLFKNLERAYSSPDRIIEAINEVFNTFCRAAKYFGGDINSMNNSGITTSQVMKDLETLKNIEEWLYRFIERFEEYISKIRKSKLRSEISEVLDYINANYSKDIDLNSAAGYVNISPAHFCTVFKKEVGVSFTDYVTSLRVERAKELIANTDLKVYEVAEAVGYPNANYFSKLFKRCTGLTPEEFKRH